MSHLLVRRAELLPTSGAKLQRTPGLFKLVLADDRMRVLFRDYIAQKVYDEIRGGSLDG